MRSRLTPTLAAGLLCSACPSYAAGGPATPSPPSVKVPAPAGFRGDAPAAGRCGRPVLRRAQAGAGENPLPPRHISFDDVRTVIDLIPNLRDRVPQFPRPCPAISTPTAPWSARRRGSRAAASSRPPRQGSSMTRIISASTSSSTRICSSSRPSRPAPRSRRRRARCRWRRRSAAPSRVRWAAIPSTMCKTTPSSASARRVSAAMPPSRPELAPCRQFPDRGRRSPAALFGGAVLGAGLDFVGQRKILGAGIATQFDTRSDKDLNSRQSDHHLPLAAVAHRRPSRRSIARLPHLRGGRPDGRYVEPAGRFLRPCPADPGSRRGGARGSGGSS